MPLGAIHQKLYLKRLMYSNEFGEERFECTIVRRVCYEKYGSQWYRGMCARGHRNDDAICSAIPATERPEQLGYLCKLTVRYSPVEVTTFNSMTLSTHGGL
jgi:hypothetical protein